MHSKLEKNVYKISQKFPTYIYEISNLLCTTKYILRWNKKHFQNKSKFFDLAQKQLDNSNQKVSLSPNFIIRAPKKKKLLCQKLLRKNRYVKLKRVLLLKRRALQIFNLFQEPARLSQIGILKQTMHQNRNKGSRFKTKQSFDTQIT